MQVRDRQAVRKLHPPPNGGMNVPQQELQPQQHRRALFHHHPTLDHHAEPRPPFCDRAPGTCSSTADAVRSSHRSGYIWLDRARNFTQRHAPEKQETYGGNQHWCSGAAPREAGTAIPRGAGGEYLKSDAATSRPSATGHTLSGSAKDAPKAGRTTIGTVRSGRHSVPNRNRTMVR